MSKIKHFRIYWANSSFSSAHRGTTIQAALKRAGFHPDVLSPDDIVMEGEKETFEFDAAKNAYVDVSVSHRWDEATRTWIKIDRDAETHSTPIPVLPSAWPKTFEA